MSIHDLVVNKIAELTRFVAEDVRVDHRLRDDLRMDEDDFSFLFVPGLERALGMALPQDDWQGVRTVGEVIRMIELKVGVTAPSRDEKAARDRFPSTD
ncbi:MAG: hypothetical protein IPJ78_16685 [Gemmatimonadetes bacterium]|nr:hypothetical protein [Gemmatimonadota bacterium]